MNKDQKIEALEERIIELEQHLAEALRFFHNEGGVDLRTARYEAMMTKIEWYPYIINKKSK